MKCTCDQDDQQQSTTASTIAQGAFSIRYADGTSAEGDYITDNFTIGGTTVSEFIMGLALSTGNQFGIMGIGLPSNEAVVQIDPGNAYPNLPVQMANLGLVSTTAYSLWLNDLDASTGSLLFGGVDTAKYHGPLSRLSLYPNPGSVNVTQFLVALTTVSATSPSGTDALGSQSFPVSAVLDSGTTFTLLPPDLVSAIWAEAGVVNKEEAGPLVPCSFSRASQGSFVFGFGGPGGPNITVPMDELVRTVPGSVGVFEDGVYKGQDACQFMITPMQSDQPVAILGDSFLRSAYVVYDLENLEVALAPTKFNATDSKVVAFDHRGAAVPDSAPAPHQDVESLQSVAIVTTNMSALTAQQGFLPANAAGRLASGKGIVAAVAVAAAMVLML